MYSTRPDTPVAQSVTSSPSDDWDVGSEPRWIHVTLENFSHHAKRWRPTTTSWLHTKFDFTVDEEKASLIPFREKRKKKGGRKHRGRKVGYTKTKQDKISC